MIDVGFAYFGQDEKNNEPIRRTLITGLNFSPTFADPFRNLGVMRGESLTGLLSSYRAGPDDPVFILVHVTTPRFVFVDKGKTAVTLPYTVAVEITDMVEKVATKWNRQRTAEFRDAAAAQRRQEALMRRDYKPITIKDAAYRVMAAAYAHAAGTRRMANARQVMYAARPYILELTGRTSFDDAYFTQTLLPDYQAEHPDETANWDVIYDDRGHFSEPHTGRTIGLGTLAVRRYLAECRKPSVVKTQISSASVSTLGPHGRYRGALFIEKEGFLPILEAARIAERFDVAIMSTKGMSVTAARQLIDGLAAHGVRVFVLHDLDIAGFSIRKTFTESGRRHQFRNNLDYVDIGLRLDDVDGLMSEPVPLKGSREALAERLQINGATEDEIEFLLGRRRVELNAMTSDQFIDFVERKLAEHGAEKVTPDDETLARAYEAFVQGKRAKEAVDAELKRIRAEVVQQAHG